MMTIHRKDLKPFEDLARSFAEKELAKKVEEHDRYPFGEFFSQVLDKAYEVGFLALLLPEDKGGIGGGIGTLSIILENICRVDSSLGGIIFTNALSQKIMLELGASDLAAEICGRASGAAEALIAFPSFTDPAHLSTLPWAEKSDNGYTVTGKIELLSLGGLARRAVIPAQTGRDFPYSFFLIDLSAQGVEKSGPVFSLGLHACPSVDLTLQCVPAKLLGNEGSGKACFDQMSARMHLAAAAMNAGIMRGSLNEATAYARERFQGGREIINWTEVSMLLADMSIKTHVAEMCVAQACLAEEQEGVGAGAYTLSAAIHIHELACEAVNDGIQVLGGNGYMKDYGQEKRYRDARMVQALLGSPPMKKLDLIRRSEQV